MFVSISKDVPLSGHADLPRHWAGKKVRFTGAQPVRFLSTGHRDLDRLGDPGRREPGRPEPSTPSTLTALRVREHSDRSCLLPRGDDGAGKPAQRKPTAVIGRDQCQGRVQCWLAVFLQVYTISWVPFVVE